MSSQFKNNLLAGFGISLVLLVVSAAASYFSITNLIKSGSMVDHTQQVLMISEKIISGIKDGETGQRGYLLTNDPDFLTPYYGASEEALKSFAELKNLTQDNISQQRNCDTLKQLIARRFAYLQLSLDNRRAGKDAIQGDLKEGNIIMTKMRGVINNIQQIEQDLLVKRTATLKKFTQYTPVLIIVAALLAIGITMFFFSRVSEDFKEKTLLTETLENKDKEIASRLRIIESIAKQVAAGNYSLRLKEEDLEELGGLATSLNKMAASLKGSFTKLEDNEWLQTGIANLSEKVAGEKDVHQLSADIISFLTEYTGSHAGAIYLTDKGRDLTLMSTYALSDKRIAKNIKSGEGIAGQSMAGNKLIRISAISEELITDFSGGTIMSKEIIAFPVTFEGNAIGVIELGTIHSYSEKQITFLEATKEISGISINTSKNRRRLKELLDETQSQSEELQAQHSELESMNAELEVHTEKLQTSEEELRVQQEELTETNLALEERSRLLEEKNKLVAIRNIEIMRKAEELQLSTKYKSEFLANMSHELRTPLNSILLLSKLLGDNTDVNLSKEQIEYANVIQSSGNSLLQLIDEILDLSRIESGKLQLDYETVRIEDLLDTLNFTFRAIAKEKNIAFTIHQDGNIPSQIETDRMRVEQILKNLISNALKFTSAGSVSLHIHPSLNKSGFLDFTVRDTGIGISEDKFDAIFEAFQQADGSTRRNYGGTGLGLSISRQLARLLAGDIGLISEEDKGSEFTLTIPVSKQIQKEVPVTNRSAELASLPAEGLRHVIDPTSNKLIAKEIPAEIPDDRDNLEAGDRVLLIVEDDTNFAKALLGYIRSQGYKGVVIVRGDQAVDMARKTQPAGILLDVQLPFKDGLEIMDELKGDVSTRHIPVHLMSSFELKKESISKGAVDFIQKPMDEAQMQMVLQKIESAVKKENKKVLIIEDNSQHAKALAYFLSNKNINTEISGNIRESILALGQNSANCVIMDMDVPGQRNYDTLDEIRQNESLKNIPIIIFTGKSLSRSEEQRIRQYADSIVIKTAHSYQRILDEVSLFLHLMDEKYDKRARAGKKMGTIDSVLKGKTVLVTDDDARNIFALGKALEKYQMNVITTMDGHEALEALNNNAEIDIVLMDIMMPGIDGLETIIRIRQQPRWKRLPVIAVTAKAMTGDREKCIQAGASDYITKPVDTDQLISLMRVWLHDTRR